MRRSSDNLNSDPILTARSFISLLILGLADKLKFFVTPFKIEQSSFKELIDRYRFLPGNRIMLFHCCLMHISTILSQMYIKYWISDQHNRHFQPTRDLRIDRPSPMGLKSNRDLILWLNLILRLNWFYCALPTAQIANKINQMNNHNANQTLQPSKYDSY